MFAHLILHTSEPVEHDGPVTSGNVINAGLEETTSNCSRNYAKYSFNTRTSQDTVANRTNEAIQSL